MRLEHRQIQPLRPPFVHLDEYQLKGNDDKQFEHVRDKRLPDAQAGEQTLRSPVTGNHHIQRL